MGSMAEHLAFLAPGINVMVKTFPLISNCPLESSSALGKEFTQKGQRHLGSECHISLQLPGPSFMKRKDASTELQENAQIIQSYCVDRIYVSPEFMLKYNPQGFDVWR